MEMIDGFGSRDAFGNCVRYYLPHQFRCHGPNLPRPYFERVNVCLRKREASQKSKGLWSLASPPHRRRDPPAAPLPNSTHPEEAESRGILEMKVEGEDASVPDEADWVDR